MSCNCRSFCDHQFNSRDVLTSLQFGVFLFAFAAFLVVTPLAYLSTGVEAMTNSAKVMGDSFAYVADGLNNQVVSFLVSEVEVAEKTGSSLAFAGNVVGDGAAMLVANPAVFGSNLKNNLRTFSRVYGPEPLHQYKWSRAQRFWNGHFRELQAQAAAGSQVAALPQ
jgi:hypothetical protein